MSTPSSSSSSPPSSSIEKIVLEDMSKGLRALPFAAQRAVLMARVQESWLTQVETEADFAVALLEMAKHEGLHGNPGSARMYLEMSGKTLSRARDLAEELLPISSSGLMSDDAARRMNLVKSTLGAADVLLGEVEDIMK